MKTILSISASLIAAALLSAGTAFAQTNDSFVANEVAACKANAGAFNGVEKHACIKVAVDKAVEACMITAAAPSMKDERDACIQVARETAR